MHAYACPRCGRAEMCAFTERVCRNMSVSCTYGDTRLWKATAWRRQVGNRQKTNTPWRSALEKSVMPVCLWWPFSVTGDLNHRNTGRATYAHGATGNERKERKAGVGVCVRGGWEWGSRVKSERPKALSCETGGKGWEKCSLWFALVCLLSAVWAAFVQWPMQLEWRLLSKSSCRAPDKRIKNYDIF